MYSYFTKKANITAITKDVNDIITNFTMSATGLWEKLEYDVDGTANYNQAGTFANSRTSVEQTAFLKFGGISNDYIKAANGAKDCCDIVVIHILNNGLRMVQGIEPSASAVGGFLGTKNRQTRIVPTINTDTSQNAARMEYSITGNANSFSLTTDLTDAEIEAL